MTRTRTLARGAIAALSLLAAMGFVALGLWQLERRAWKHALIASVEARIDRPPVLASAGNAAAYTRVSVTGRYLARAETRVRAVTDLGAGYWLMTPLDAGAFTVLINRGFVPPDARAAAPPAGQATVTGLLRTSEPGGGFLRTNDPARSRWYSRDVAAIAKAHKLRKVAPYFIDAAAGPTEGYPIGGLTVVRFTDNHMSYAFTWFAMAGLSLAGLWFVVTRRIG